MCLSLYLHYEHTNTHTIIILSSSTLCLNCKHNNNTIICQKKDHTLWYSVDLFKFLLFILLIENLDFLQFQRFNLFLSQQNLEVLCVKSKSKEIDFFSSQFPDQLAVCYKMCAIYVHFICKAANPSSKVPCPLLWFCDWRTPLLLSV